MHSLDMRSEERLPMNQQSFLPHFKKSWRSSPLINSQKEKKKKDLLAHCGAAAHRAAVYNPLHFSLDLKSGVTGKQVASKFDGAARFFRLDNSAKRPRVLIFKGLSFLETSVFMMHIIWSVIKVKLLE